MRTEEDLRDALEHLADQAPHPGGIRATLGSRDPRRSRRTALIIGTAIATATAAVAVAVVPHLVSGEESPAAEDKRNTAWSRWVDLNLPRHIEAVGQMFTENRQDYELYEAVQLTWPEYCQLQLHRNGDFDPSTIPAGSPTIDLAGHQARVVTSAANKPFLPAPQGYRFRLIAAVQKALVWQPVDGVWALLSCESQRKLGTKQVPTIDGPLDTNLNLAISLAESFSPPTRSLGSPVKLGELPTGVAPRRINYEPFENGVPGSGESFTVTASDGNPATGFQPVPPKPNAPVSFRVWDPARGDDLRIRFSTDKFWNQLSRFPDLNKPVAIIHGMKAYYYSGMITYSKRRPSDPPNVDSTPPFDTLRLEGNGVGIDITSLVDNPSKVELRRIAESLQLTPTPNQPATWFDAATAIP